VGTVILHAGMPKAGSSSVQTWIKDNVGVLRDAGCHLLVYRRAKDLEVPGVLAPYRKGLVNSGGFVRRYFRSNRPASIVEELLRPLDQLAEELGTVLISGEGLATLFAAHDEQFIERLNALGQKHRIRVAYYVRPQHESLEAAWRQWGFRQKWRPHAFVRMREPLLAYAQTRYRMGLRAPDVSFEMRLFHRDLLRETSVVEDFARTFIGLDDVVEADSDIWTNPGLPLELVNILRAAEPGRFWSSAHDNSRIKVLKQLTAGWRVPPSEEVRRSRQLLQQHCYQRFDPGNAYLVTELGWPLDHLVPPVTDDDFTPGPLTQLNQLWATRTSSAEQELLFLALEELLAARRPTAQPGEPDDEDDDDDEEDVGEVDEGD
jgi:hypothetical protein